MFALLNELHVDLFAGSRDTLEYLGVFTTLEKAQAAIDYRVLVDTINDRGVLESAFWSLHYTTAKVVITGKYGSRYTHNFTISDCRLDVPYGIGRIAFLRGGYGWSV